MLYYTILYYTILYYTTLYYTILYYTILYYTILYYTILYYTITILLLYYYYASSVRVYINKLNPLIEIPIFCTLHQTFNCGSKGLSNTDCYV